MLLQWKINTNELIILVFFALLLFLYGRGINFDVVADEYQLKGAVENVSKAPFLIGMTLFFFLLANKKERLNFNYIVGYQWWILIFVITFISVFFHNDLWSSVKNWGTIFFSYTLFFLFIRFVHKVNFERLEILFIYISFAVSLLCALFHVLQGHNIVFFPDREEANLDRLGGLFYYAHTGALIGITLVFAFKKFLEGRQLAYLLIMIISLVLLIATDTRSAWFSVAFSLVFLTFKKISFYKIFLVAVVCYLMLSVAPAFFKTESSVSNVESSSEYRKMIWVYTLKVALNNIAIGYGGEDALDGNKFEYTENLRDPHNSLISLLLQSGIIVVILYILIFVKSIKACINKFDNDYRFLFFYWLFFPFFWSNLYNHLSGFIPMYMFFTIYAFALNPKYIQKRIKLYILNGKRT